MLLRLAVAYLLLAPPARPKINAEVALKSFLGNWLGELQPGEVPAFHRTFVDLNGDGNKEVIVYFTDQWSCGSGGCTMLVLTPDGDTFHLVTRTTITQLPIRLLRSRTNGWRDLSVVVRGGGILPGYQAQLRFNGHEYPSNPSMPPAVAITGKVKGKVLLSPSSESVALMAGSK